MVDVVVDVVVVGSVSMFFHCGRDLRVPFSGWVSKLVCTVVASTDACEALCVVSDAVRVTVRPSVVSSARISVVPEVSVPVVVPSVGTGVGTLVVAVAVAVGTCVCFVWTVAPLLVVASLTRSSKFIVGVSAVLRSVVVPSVVVIVIGDIVTLSQSSCFTHLFNSLEYKYPSFSQ